MPVSALPRTIPPPFQGFGLPEQNWFKMPNEWTDITAEITSLAELKVVEYVLKHTWGYQEYGIAKRITTEEFMYGRKRKDGERIDRGTGLSNRSVIDGLRRAVEHGYLTEEVDDQDRARIKKYYALRMSSAIEQSAPSLDDDQTGVKILHTGVKNLPTGVNDVHSSCEETTQRTEQDTLERKNNSSDETKTVVVALREKGIGEQVISRLVSHYNQARIFEKIDYLAYLLETAPNKVKRPAGWLRRAIEEDYGPPDGYKSKAEREATAAAKKQCLAVQQKLVEERNQSQLVLTQQKASDRFKRLETLRKEYGTSEQGVGLWQQVLSSLKPEMTEVTFNTYLARCALIALADGQVILGVPNRFTKEWIESRLLTKIQRTLAGYLDGSQVVVQCLVLDDG